MNRTPRSASRRAKTQFDANVPGFFASPRPRRGSFTLGSNQKSPKSRRYRSGSQTTPCAQSPDAAHSSSNRRSSITLLTGSESGTRTMGAHVDSRRICSRIAGIIVETSCVTTIGNLWKVLRPHNVKRRRPPANAPDDSVPEIFVSQPLHRFLRRASKRSRRPRGDHSSSWAPIISCSSRRRHSKYSASCGPCFK